MLSRLCYRVARALLGRGVKSLKPFRSAVEEKHGIEMGGPSVAFGDAGMLPIYRYIGQLDNVTFSSSTVWAEDSGASLICDATDLSSVPDGRYHFVLSCHNLEHIANPLKALREWGRVMSDSGSLILVLPDYRYTFDHKRQPTSVTHMLGDYEHGVDEGDLTHLPEILELHDLNRDPGAGTWEQFRERSLRNLEYRCLHHHVFNAENSQELLQVAGFSIQLVETVKPIHIVLLATKTHMSQVST
jgi:SAM-dependent methyltransferase